jgi:hypothetical protein
MRQLEKLASLLRVVPSPVNESRTSGTLRAELQAGGRIIGNNVLWDCRACQGR